MYNTYTNTVDEITTMFSGQRLKFSQKFELPSISQFILYSIVQSKIKEIIINLNVFNHITTLQ